MLARSYCSRRLRRRGRPASSATAINVIAVIAPPTCIGTFRQLHRDAMHALVEADAAQRIVHAQERRLLVVDHARQPGYHGSPTMSMPGCAKTASISSASGRCGTARAPSPDRQLLGGSTARARSAPAARPTAAARGWRRGSAASSATPRPAPPPARRRRAARDRRRTRAERRRRSPKTSSPLDPRRRAGIRLRHDRMIVRRQDAPHAEQIDDRRREAPQSLRRQVVGELRVRIGLAVIGDPQKVQ